MRDAVLVRRLKRITHGFGYLDRLFQRAGRDDGCDGAEYLLLRYTHLRRGVPGAGRTDGIEHDLKAVRARVLARAALEQDDEGIRFRAIGLLARSPDEANIPALLKCCHGDSERVQDAAVAALSPLLGSFVAGRALPGARGAEVVDHQLGALAGLPLVQHVEAVPSGLASDLDREVGPLRIVGIGELAHHVDADDQHRLQRRIRRHQTGGVRERGRK